MKPSQETSNTSLNLLSVIIPARNEEGSLKQLVEGLLKRYGSRICQVIIVNDNSWDCTATIAEELASNNQSVKVIHRTPPAGVGLAMREGFQAVSANASHVLMMDGDFVANVSEVADLLDKSDQGYDIVFGSRYCWAFGFYGYPYLKRVSNRAFHFLAKQMLGIKVNDLSNNFKIIKKEILKRCTFHATDFAINAETGLYPVMQGASWCEVPVKWVTRSSTMGNSKFSVFKIAHSYFRVLINCRKANKANNHYNK